MTLGNVEQDTAITKEQDKEQKIEARTLRRNRTLANKHHKRMQIITINVSIGTLRRIERVLDLDCGIAGRSELIRRFISDGLDKLEDRQQHVPQ